MPGQNGLACAKNQVSPPRLRNSNDYRARKFQYAQESVKLGVRDILLKPLDKEEMEQALGRTLKEYWMRHVLDNVLQMIWSNDNNLVVLLRQAAPGNDICGLCSQIIAAVETAEGQKIEKSIEAYLSLIKRWDIPAARLFGFMFFPPPPAWHCCATRKRKSQPPFAASSSFCSRSVRPRKREKSSRPFPPSAERPQPSSPPAVQLHR